LFIDCAYGNDITVVVRIQEEEKGEAHASPLVSQRRLTAASARPPPRFSEFASFRRPPEYQ
jgi:hypothetical protein